MPCLHRPKMSDYVPIKIMDDADIFPTFRMMNQRKRNKIEKVIKPDVLLVPQWWNLQFIWFPALWFYLQLLSSHVQSYQIKLLFLICQKAKEENQLYIMHMYLLKPNQPLLFGMIQAPSQPPLSSGTGRWWWLMHLLWWTEYLINKTIYK